jgi:NAD(P)-dependent dehydrogenase (short-subunit alcohol dehydrogenase family)
VSRGLGQALFSEFHRAGDRILALGRRFSAEQRAAADAGRIVLRTTDFTVPSALPDLAELRAFLDGHEHREIVLVHNAAVFEPFGRVGQLAPADLVAAVAINLTAPMLLTNSLLAVRAPDEPVTIVHISSSAAHNLGGGRAIYGATKRAGEWFCQTVLEEHGEDPTVRVVIVDPGIMDTEMQAGVRRHAREDAYFPGRERFLLRHERGELPSPSRVARSIITSHLANRPG